MYDKIHYKLKNNNNNNKKKEEGLEIGNSEKMKELLNIDLFERSDRFGNSKQQGYCWLIAFTVYQLVFFFILR